MRQSARGRPSRVRASTRGRVISLGKDGLFKLELSILSFSRGRPARNRVVFIISGRIRARRRKPSAKQTPLNWPYSSRRFRPLVTRDGETPSEGFPLMKTARFLAGPPQKVAYAAKGRAWVRWRLRLGRLPLPRENLVESEIDKPAEEVHEGVDGVGGAEMQDARSQDFPTYCAQCREKEGRPQAANNLSA